MTLKERIFSVLVHLALLGMLIKKSISIGDVGIDVRLLIIGFFFFFVGGVLNVTVMLLNGGNMPVKVPANMNFVSTPSHSIMAENSRLKYFADIIPSKKYDGITIYLSIGDLIVYSSSLLVAVGLSIMIIHELILSI